MDFARVGINIGRAMGFMVAVEGSLMAPMRDMYGEDTARQVFALALLDAGNQFTESVNSIFSGRSITVVEDLVCDLLGSFDVYPASQRVRENFMGLFFQGAG